MEHVWRKKLILKLQFIEENFQNTIGKSFSNFNELRVSKKKITLY